MTIVCGECKKSIEINCSLEDRQEIVCPHCGAVSEYSKPIRIELPERIERPTRIQLPQEYEDIQIEVSSKEVFDSSSTNQSSKPKLKVIRPESSLAHDSTIAANYEMREVSEHLDRLKEYKEQEDELSRRVHKRNLMSNILTIFLGLSIIGGLWVGYQQWTEYKRRKAEEYNRILEERNRENERYEEERRLSEERSRAEREAKKEQERLEEEARRKKLREEKEREEVERATMAECYKMYDEGLRSNEFDLYTKNLEASFIKNGETVCYCLPSEDNFNMPLYQVSYETNGQMSVSRIFKSGRKEKLDTDVFKQRVSTTDCMVVYGQKVYFRSSRKNPGVGILPKDVGCDPSKIFFGDIANTLDRLNPVYDELSYDIVFITDKDKKQLLVENLSFGCRYSIQNVYEAIEKAYPNNSANKVSSRRTKRFKRTVLFWNGSHIKTSIEGITYVPRTYIPGGTRTYNSISSSYTRSSYRSDSGYARWRSLYDQAMREEEAEANYYEKSQRRRESEAFSQREKANDEWSKKIEEIFRKGQLFYRIRKVRNSLSGS